MKNYHLPDMETHPILIDKNRYEALRKAIKHNDQHALDSLKSFFSQRNTTTQKTISGKTAATEADELVTEDEFVASYPDGDDPGYYPYSDGTYIYDYTSNQFYHEKFINIVKLSGYLPRRGIDFNVRIPYYFYFKNGAAGAATQYPSDLSNYNKWIYIVGDKLGDFSTGYIVWNIFNTEPYKNPVTGSVDGSIQEYRTVLVSIQGSVKLVGSIAGAGMSVGAEVESGFTLGSKYNSTTLYDFTGAFTIECREWFNKPLHKNCIFGVRSNGIQRN